MDVEKTIEFLLKNQARMDARFAAQFDRAEERFRKWEARVDRSEARMERSEARMERFEARLNRLERVVALNNRVVTRLVRYGVSLRGDVRRLTRAQVATDRTLRTLIQTMIHRNGDR